MCGKLEAGYDSALVQGLRPLDYFAAAFAFVARRLPRGMAVGAAVGYL